MATEGYLRQVLFASLEPDPCFPLEADTLTLALDRSKDFELAYSTARGRQRQQIARDAQALRCHSISDDAE
jgi:hypothetical protein